MFPESNDRPQTKKNTVLKVKTPERPEDGKEPNQVEAEAEAGQVGRINQLGLVKNRIAIPDYP